MSDNDSPDAIVVGSYVQDHAWFTERFPDVGETRLANGFNTGPGGKGFNQAIACTRQGASTLFIGSLGNDHLGNIGQQFARDEPLACRWQVHEDVATAASSIIVDAEGRNQIVFNPGANMHLSAGFLIAQDALFAAGRVLLLQLENNIEATTAALQCATQHGLLRVLNPAPPHDRFDATLLAQCDLATPNETEFALLFERCTGERISASDLAEHRDADLHALAGKIGVACVVITLGEHGCFVSHTDADLRNDKAAFYRVPREQVKTIDSTGAGDAFNGALVAAMLRFGDRPFQDAVRHANRAAALSTEKIGTAPAMATFDEVLEHFGD